MFLKSLALSNVLSFRETKVELRDLNVIIGANGSGKSNLIDCIGLLRAMPTSLNSALLRGGGVAQWIWKGAAGAPQAQLKAVLSGPAGDLEYGLAFVNSAHSLVIEWEELRGPGSHFFRRIGSRGVFPGGPAQIFPADSAFAVYRNPADPTPITDTAQRLSNVRIYREFLTGATDQSRSGTSASAPKHPLNEDGSNLAVLLQEMDFHGSRRQVELRLGELVPDFGRIVIRPEDGVLRLYVEEQGLGNISANRLSDGTLKFLCLMAVLYDHEPPPLVCIEEPENGLHPEALCIVAAALKDASTRTQLIVTTHSEALVDALTDEPESVLVCERHFDEGTQFRRLSSERLSEWLETYTLGQLWRKGEIGGTRW